MPAALITRALGAARPSKKDLRTCRARVRSLRARLCQAGSLPGILPATVREDVEQVVREKEQQGNVTYHVTGTVFCQPQI